MRASTSDEGWTGAWRGAARARGGEDMTRFALLSSTAQATASGLAWKSELRKFKQVPACADGAGSGLKPIKFKFQLKLSS